MDSIESPSKSYQSSFGLLDDNLINEIDDASFNGDKSNEQQQQQQLKTNTKSSVLSNIINNKQSQQLPPPSRSKQQQQQQQEEYDENDLNEENVNNGEMTVENVVINDSELSELENEFSTFSDDDDDENENEESDENKQAEDEQIIQKEEQKEQEQVPFTKMIDLFTYKPEKPLLNRDLSCIHEENDYLNDNEKYSKFFTNEEIGMDQQSNLIENESSKILETNEKDSILTVDSTTQNKLNCETPTALKSSLSFTSSINSGYNTEGLSQYSTEKAKHQPYSIQEDNIEQLKPTQLFNTKSQAFNLSSFNLNNSDRLASLSMFDSSKQDNEPRLTLSSSLYFKPSNELQLNEDSLKGDQEESTASNTTASTFKFGGSTTNQNQNANDTTNLYDNFGFGADAQKEFFAQENINFSCDFKAGEELLNEPEMIVENNGYNGNGSSDVSGSDHSKQTEDPSWWHLHSQQPSKLDLSNLTSINASMNQDNNNKISVGDYFTRKSSIPKYLAEQEQKSLLNLTKEFNDENGMNKTNDIVKEYAARKSLSFEQQQQQNQHQWNEKTTLNDFTLSNMPSAFCSENSGFSFTFNANDTGDFIQKIDKNMKKTEKYQTNNEKTSILHSTIDNTDQTTLTTTTIKRSESQATIKDIGDDLNRITSLLSSRLALSESKRKSNEQQQQQQSQLSSSKLKSTTTTTTTKTSNKPTGSLTSTPAKTSSCQTDDNLDGQNTPTDTKSKTQINQNTLFNQESFISSIADNRNETDTTLISTDSDIRTTLSERRNAEIQTSPIKNGINCQKDSSSMKKDSTITAAAPPPPPPTTSTTQSNNNIGLINTSTISSISSILSSAATHTQNAQGNLTGMVPVAFLPIEALLPCVQKFYDDFHAKHKLESNNMSTNSKPYNQPPPQYTSSNMKDNNLYDFDNIFQTNRHQQYPQQQQQQQFGSKPYDMSCVPDREYSTITSSSTNPPVSISNYPNDINKQQQQQQQYQIEQLPQIEYDRFLVDFGYIAEGCRDARKFNIRELATNNGMNASNDYYLLIEINESNIKINNSFLIKNKQLEDDIKEKLKQIFYFNNQQTQKVFKLDTPNVVNSQFKSYEICLNVDTYDLNIFRESKLYQNDKEQQLTLDIQFKLTITCCFKTNNRKYFLCQIDSKLLLGYARLKTTANIDTIDFIVDKRVNQTTTPSTITYSINESTRQRLIPLSNAGNIPINVHCYLFDANIDLVNYKVNIEPEIVYLDSNSKSKNVCLSLIKSESLVQSQAATDVTSVNTKLIVEVMPNGFKYEIPVTIKLNEIIEQRKTIKILSNKTILHFSACDPNESAVQELNLMNPNNFTVKCLIRLCTMNEINQEKSDENCYLFDDYHYTNNNNSSTSLNQTENNDKTSIICEIKPQQSTVLKIKFKPLINKLEFMNQTSVCNGVVRIKTLDYDLRFNVKIVGFIGKLNVAIDGDTLCEVQNAQITNSQISKLFFNLKQQKLYQTNIDTRQQQQQRNVRTAVAKVNNKFSKELLIKNLSVYTKSFIKFIVLDDNLKMIQNLENNDLIKLSNDYFILEPNQKQILNVDISLPQQQLPQRSTFFYLVLLCVEFDLFMYCYQNIQTKLNEEQEKKQREEGGQSTMAQHQSGQFNVDNYVSEMLFSSVNLTQFMTNNQDRLSILSSTSQQSSSICSLNMTNSNDYSLLLINTKKVKISKDDLIKYFKQSLNYSVVKFNCSNDPLQKSNVSSKPQAQQIPESMFKRASPGNSRQVANQRYSLSVVNDMKQGLTSKAGTVGANFTRHSLNFDSMNDTVISSDTTINHLIDFTLNKTNDDTLDAGGSTKQTNIGSQDQQSWSISPTEIVLNVNEANFGSQQGTITISNNSNKEMIFDFIFRRPCLSIEPERGNLSPRSSVKIQVKLKREILNKLPWQGAISVLCNRTQKDIRILVNQAVTQPPPPAPNTSSRNLLSSASKNTTATSAGYTTLSEQGSLLSELTQYSLDTMSLTPLMNATLLQSGGGGNANQSTLSNTTKTKQTNNEFFLSSTTNSAVNKSNISRTLNDSTQLKSNVKIVRIGNDAHITFAQVSINGSSSAELTLTNPTKNYVRWKAYSLAPAFIRANDNEMSSSNLHLSLTQSTLMKSSYSVFVVNPTSGVIPPTQKQIIKIEFYPREATGLFTQYWEIDTRSDSFDTKTTASQKGLCDSYNCKLVLNGVSVDAGLSMIGPSSNTLGSKSVNIYENSMQSFNNKKAVSFTDSKENVEPLLTGAKALTKPKTGVYIKENSIEFPDTEPNQVSKVCFLVNNTENRVAKLTIMKLLEPFHCKHVTLNIKAKHYLKIPIEFQPVQLGNYVDKILVRVDDEDVPLTCILRGKCVKKSN